MLPSASVSRRSVRQETAAGGGIHGAVTSHGNVGGASARVTYLKVEVRLGEVLVQSRRQVLSRGQDDAAGAHRRWSLGRSS